MQLCVHLTIYNEEWFEAEDIQVNIYRVTTGFLATFCGIAKKYMDRSACQITS